MKALRRSRLLALLVGGGLVALLALPPLGRGYAALCAQPISTYGAIAAARDEARAAAAAPGSGPSGARAEGERRLALRRLGAALRAQLIDTALQVKQSDPVAFPVHVTAATALELGGCPAASTYSQWRKAAAHALGGPGASLAAEGLARTDGVERGRSAIVADLQRFAAEEPWHAENLERVVLALER